MKFLFKKRQLAKQEPSVNKMHLLVYTFYKLIQKKWVLIMEHSTKKLSPNWLKVCFAFFVLLSSTQSVFLIIKSFSSERKAALVINHTVNPQNIAGKTDVKSGANIISEKEYNRINRFRRYMDSLSSVPSGQATYDSIVRLHPGLMDSLRAVENYYKPQF